MYLKNKSLTVLLLCGLIIVISCINAQAQEEVQTDSTTVVSEQSEVETKEEKKKKPYKILIIIGLITLTTYALYNARSN